MLKILQEHRLRDPSVERREQRSYRLLRAIYDRTRDSGVALSGLELGDALSLSREETFRIIQSLAHHGYVHYVGAGPRVSISARGIEYVERDAGRRRSIRS